MKKFWNWTEQEEREELFEEQADDGCGEKRKNGCEKKPKCRELRLEGVIAEESWWGDEVTPKMFRDELFEDDGDITVWINSPGGDVIAASVIYTMLNEYKRKCGNVSVKIEGMAASAASVISMAGTTVSMSPTALMMIHNPMTAAVGNREEMERAIQLLDEVKESIINAYEEKTGLSRARISHMMNNETWMSAGQAHKLGFIDEILYDGRSVENGGSVDNVYMFSQAVTNLALMNRIAASTEAKAADTDVTDTVCATTAEPDRAVGKADAAPNNEAIATEETEGVDAKVLYDRLMSKKYF